MKVCFIYLLVVVQLAVLAQIGSSQKCYTVKTGQHYPTIIPFHGILNNRNELYAKIKFSQNSAKYMFKADDPKGQLCTSSWNKLFGTTRCSFDPHSDSDRFVWRRAYSCVQFAGQFAVGEKPDCADNDLIELAAYAYDKGSKPFENIGVLLKEFKTKVRVETYFGYRVKIFPTYTAYELSTEDGDILEEIRIEHRDCGATYLIGALQKLYFGGQCPAPQDVTACYIE